VLELYSLLRDDDCWCGLLPPSAWLGRSARPPVTDDWAGCVLPTDRVRDKESFPRSSYTYVDVSPRRPDYVPV